MSYTHLTSEERFCIAHMNQKNDYKAVYDELYQIAKDFKPVKRKTKKHLKLIAKINASPSPRLGVHLLVSDSHLESKGYCSVKTKSLLNDALFSEGTFIVYTRRHFSVIKDGVLFDSYDSRMTEGVFSEKKVKTVTRYWSIDNTLSNLDKQWSATSP